MFYVGQRVVLVGWKPLHVGEWLGIGAIYPDVGEVYTVRKIMPWRDTAVLLLAEVNNEHIAPLCGGLEPGICQEFFRPVIENKTRISVSASRKIHADA